MPLQSLMILASAALLLAVGLRGAVVATPTTGRFPVDPALDHHHTVYNISA